MVTIPPARVVFEGKDREGILGRINECLTTGMLAQGKYVAEFEKKWAHYVGARYAVAVSSGSSAIEISMRILQVRDKEVLVPVNTFLATAAGVILAGGRVRFVDVDPATFSPSLRDLRKRLTRRTVGAVIVHIGGIITPEIGGIKDWCERQGLWLFEDCAHAHGSEMGGKRAGRFGIAGGYSFFATKVMTSGEGGMIVTDSEGFAQEAKLLRNHGKPEPWVSYHTVLGSNWRMSELNAAVGLGQLARLDDFISWREKIARIYTELLSRIPGLTPVLPQGRSSWYKYIVLLDREFDKEKLKKNMKARGVSLSGEVYETPLHRQPVFAGKVKGAFPKAEDISQRHICLPLYYGMSEEEARSVVEALERSLKEA